MDAFFHAALVATAWFNLIGFAVLVIYGAVTSK